jgi:hypothetical protein
MNLKLAGALVAATAAISVLAGCPMGTPNVTPTAAPFAYSPDALITGKVLYDNKPLDFADETYQHKVTAKDVATAQTLTVTAPVYEGQYFEFKSGVTEGKKYQLVSDYKGVEPSKAADVNMIRLFATNPVEAKKGVTPPMTTIDLEWVLNPTVGYNAEATKSEAVNFKVDKIVNLDAEYQLRVVKADDDSEVYVAPAYKATPEFDYTPAATGSYKYHVRFKKTGKATYSGTDAFFGDSFFIPFTVK